ncbi:hypothetical protein MASR2M48_26420 [Spirochaetota bacterium]|jgi:FdhD protein
MSSTGSDRIDPSREVHKKTLLLAPETAFELRSNDKKIALLMCTPRNLDDLSAGYLLSHDSLNDPDAAKPECLPAGFIVALTLLKSWAMAMYKAAELYAVTGGMHCAALALQHGASEPKGPDARLSMAGTNPSIPDGAMYFVVREDVGRHNAVDKVIGRGCIDMVDFASACILSSGRIAADMVLKAAVARVPVIVSRSIPTTAAFDLAQELGLTIVGRIGDEEPAVYTNPERVLL